MKRQFLPTAGTDSNSVRGLASAFGIHVVCKRTCRAAVTAVRTLLQAAVVQTEAGRGDGRLHLLQGNETYNRDQKIL